jgi:(R,R)-butanediol dehydrogenase/meso-butanediol dehydrogenase/diacetyl reductase/L-iditol 2-dehydrogenase
LRGADLVADPLTEDVAALTADLTGGRGFDVVIETSGSAAACVTAMDIAARGATVEFLATYAPTATYTLPLGNAFMREITLVTGVFQSPYMFPRAVALSGRLDLEALVTEFPAEDFEAAFEAQRTGTAIKSVLNFTN